MPVEGMWTAQDTTWLEEVPRVCVLEVTIISSQASNGVIVHVSSDYFRPDMEIGLYSFYTKNMIARLKLWGKR